MATNLLPDLGFASVSTPPIRLKLSSRSGQLSVLRRIMRILSRPRMLHPMAECRWLPSDSAVPNHLSVDFLRQVSDDD